MYTQKIFSRKTFLRFKEKEKGLKKIPKIPNLNEPDLLIRVCIFWYLDQVLICR